MVAHTFNPSTWESEAFWVRGQPGLQSEFQDRQAGLYRETHVLQNKKEFKNKKRKEKEESTTMCTAKEFQSVCYTPFTFFFLRQNLPAIFKA